jgi:hypothetical protein
MFVRMLNRRNDNQTNQQQTSTPTSKTLSSAINKNSTNMMIIERKISLATKGLQRYVENWLRITLEALKVYIHNYGGTTANNVQVSMEANLVKFLNATSYPYEKITFDNSSRGKALVQIGTLPPLLEEIIILNIQNYATNDNQPVTTFVKSDETGGYTTWGSCEGTSCRLLVAIALIVGFVAVFIIAILRILYGRQSDKSYKKDLECISW